MSTPGLEPLLTNDQIAAKVAELGQVICDDFPAGGSSVPLWLIGALKGAVFFQADRLDNACDVALARLS